MNWIESALPFGFLILFLYVFHLMIHLVNYFLDESTGGNIKQSKE